MDSERKQKLARILGYVCLAVGALNVVLAGILMLRDQTQVGALLGSGAGALTMGIIMLAVTKRKPDSEA